MARDEVPHILGSAHVCICSRRLAMSQSSFEASSAPLMKAKCLRMRRVGPIAAASQSFIVPVTSSTATNT